MLRTNSKKAIANIKQYIIDNTDINSNNFEEVATYIIDNFNSYNCYYEVLRCGSYQASFKYWLYGLPSCLNLPYIYEYGESAKNDLMNILEETSEEANKYTEEQAEDLIAYLIYRELTKVANIKIFYR